MRLNRTECGALIFAIIIFIFVAVSTYAQDNDSYDQLVKSLREAAMEKDNTKRLAAYDSVVKMFGIADQDLVRSVAGSDQPYKWAFDTQIDPLSDSLRYFFVLVADAGANEYGQSPVLVLRSDGGEPELYVNWSTYPGNDAEDFKYKRKYVTIRVDSEPPSTSLWALSTDNEATFCPNDDVLELLGRIGNGTRLVVRCTPYDANPITAVFDIRGLKSVSMTYNKALGWW